MSVIVTGTFPKSLQIGAQAITFWGDYDERDLLYTSIFDTLGSSDLYEEDTLITGFGLMPKKNQTANVAYDSMTQGYTTRYTQQTYGLGYQVSFEQQKFGKYVDIMEKGMRHLATSLKETKEITTANVLNNGFDSTFTGGDGKELFATDHPSRAGDFSNELATPADFSESALEDLLIQIFNATNDRGIRVNLKAKSLCVPSALKFQADRVIYSNLQSGTANNDLNAMKHQGIFPDGVLVNPYFTSDKRFFIKTTAPNGLKFFESVSGEFSNDGDFDSADHKYKLLSLFATGWTDPRGVYGSAGL